MKKPVPTAPFDTDTPMSTKTRTSKIPKKIRFHVPYVATHIARIRFVNESFSNGWNPKFYDTLFLRSCGIVEESVPSEPRVGTKR